MDIDLVAVTQAVPVTICFRWVGVVRVEFVCITQAVFVSIRQLRIGFMDGEFIRVRKTIRVRVLVAVSCSVPIRVLS